MGIHGKGAKMASADSLVYVESADANSLGSQTPREHARVAARIAAERGHPAESIVKTAAGHIITPEGFSDTAFDVSVATQRAAAARAVEESRWGLPNGADYVGHHMFTAAAMDPAFGALETPPWPLAYVSARGDYWGTRAVAAGTYGSVSDIRLTPDGRTALSVQFCRDPVASSYCLFAHDLGSGQVRLIARTKDPMDSYGEMSVSPDGRYLLTGYPIPVLIDITTGHGAGIGRSYRAATWYPKGGASCILAATGGNEPPWKLVLVDLATFGVEELADLPRRVDGLAAAADGTIAARINAEGEEGWVVELAVSTDGGKSFDPVAPLRGRSGWLRRGGRPRWVEAAPGGTSAGPVTLHAGFEEFLRAEPPANGFDQGEISWVLKTAAYLIKQRATRLRDKPPAADVVIDQLCILTTLPALFDRDMAAEVIRQVVPVARSAAGRNKTLARVVDRMAAVAAGRQTPPFTITFG